jgi:hypothetical protein
MGCKILTSYHNVFKGNKPYMMGLILCMTFIQETKYANDFFLVTLKGNKIACCYTPF